VSTDVRWPQLGDSGVDFFAAQQSYQRDRVGSVVTVRTVSETLIITSDGERYNRAGLFPAAQGKYSGRRLVPAGDPRVLAARGRDQLIEVARVVSNLAQIDHRTPEDVVAALARAQVVAHDAWKVVGAMMSAASKAEQESNR
jgi:hypothetical protein